MIRYYLGEEPILDNVRTYMLDDREQREHVLSRLSELVVKPTSESGGKGVFIGPTASEQEIERQRRLVEAAAGALDRPGARAALDLPDRDGGRPAGAAARRPAAVRGVRRRHPHRPGRAHARRAARGLDDRQLLAGRRLEGHVGARGGARRRPRRGSTRARRGRRRRCRTCSRLGGWSSQQQVQQQ